jgi:hypothetical protein
MDGITADMTSELVIPDGRRFPVKNLMDAERIAQDHGWKTVATWNKKTQWLEYQTVSTKPLGKSIDIMPDNML